MDDEIIITLEIGREEIQSFAENNFGRELTDLEINRIKQYWYECESGFDGKMSFIEGCIRDAIDDKNGWWRNVDKEYLDTRQHKDSGLVNPPR